LRAGSFAELVVLDVVAHERESLGVFAEVLDGDRRASLHLPGCAFLVVLAVTQPLAELLAGLNSDQGDVVGLSQGLERNALNK